MAPKNSALDRELTGKNVSCSSTMTCGLPIPDKRVNCTKATNQFDEESTPETPAEETLDVASRTTPPKSYPWEIVWSNAILLVYIHIGGLYGFYLIFAEARALTTFWMYVIGIMGGLGTTAGAHRLWAHKAYKASWQLRAILVVFQTLAFQRSIREWVRDHRVHHKFSETDADPHNATRGFFFAHVGWIVLKKHAAVRSRGQTVDLSDLDRDALVVWQRRWYWLVAAVLAFAIPTCVPTYSWGESLRVSWHVTLFRCAILYNITWLVNSAAHIWGNKPFDRSISPSENAFVSLVALGEGWHNYHHVFPWDYKTAELGNYRCNPTTAFIDFFARVGWAYDLKTVTEDMIRRRVIRTGDGSYGLQEEHVDEDGDSLREGTAVGVDGLKK